jgi:citrate lyase subunit beta/citryl-CoA lyase
MQPRSYLFVPGHRPDRFDKACAAGADQVIIDLEDAVPPADKAKAREAVAAWLSPDRPVLVRINGADSEWFGDDLALCGKPGVAGIVLPKAEREADLAALAAAGAQAIVPLIESALGLWHCAALARMPRVERLVFGSIDFSFDLGIREGFDDTLRARALGFGAKLCIHPKQVGPVNDAFVPTGEELAWAGRVLAANEKAQGAAVAVDGKMVDRPVVLIAQQMLDEARRRGRA